MKIRFGRVGDQCPQWVAVLTPTEHPKGGDAWKVAIDGAEVGTLRRWERYECHMKITPTRGTFRKRRVTYWTVYVGTAQRVCDSRADALRNLRTMHAMREDVPDGQ